MTAFRERGGTIIGIDVSLPVNGNPFVSETRLIEDGVWPLADASIDLVFSDWVLEHVATPQTFFAECSRVLRPGGVFLARTLQRWSVAGMGARIVPHRFHQAMIGRLQPAMDPEDVFPTALVCNTEQRLRRLTEENGLGISNYASHLGLAGYGGRSPAVQRALGAIEARLPRAMWQTTVFEAVKVTAG